ncbi:MAG: DUF6263 family protein [Planctomycetota bacterium]
MKRTFAVGTALLLASLVEPSARAQQTVRYRASEGETFSYILKSKMTLRSPGLDVTIRGESVYGFTCRNGAPSFEIEGKILREKFDMEMKIPMIGNLSGKVDTAKANPEPPENPMDLRRAIVYGFAVKHKARTGKPFTLVVGERGNLIRIRGLQSLLRQVLEAIDSDSAISPMLVPSLKQDVTEVKFRQSVEGFFLTFPEKAVKEGETWSWDTDRTMDDNSVLALRSTATLGKMKEGFVDFGVRSRLKKEGQEIKPRSENPVEKILSAKVETYKEDVEGLIDLSNGRPVFASYTVTYVAVLKMENALNGEIKERKSTLKLEVEQEYTPGLWEEKKEEKKE